MSQLNHPASNAWTVPVSLVGGATGNHVIRVTSKTSGDVAGAAGNDWVMLFDRYTRAVDSTPLLTDVLRATMGRRQLSGESGLTSIALSPPTLRRLRAQVRRTATRAG